MLDGWSARRLGQETRAGAVLDIVSDRACTSVLCAGLVTVLPGVTPVAIVFLLSFMVLDTMLSLAFLCWPVLSPNYFHLVDRRVWELNWSPLAKAANTAGVVGAVAIGLHGVALVVALAIAALKVWSSVRVVRLPGAGRTMSGPLEAVLALLYGVVSALVPRRERRGLRAGARRSHEP